jgi:hypothetical protein
MTDEQILELVKEHFVEEEVDDDGYCWIEFAGKPDAFLKFARTMYEEGYDKGYDEGYSNCSIDMGDENV